MSLIEIRRKFNKQAVYYFLANNEGSDFTLADIARSLRIGRSHIKEYLDQLQDEGYVNKMERITEYHDRSKYSIKGD